MRRKIIATFDHVYDESGAKVKRIMRNFMSTDCLRNTPQEADAKYIAPAYSKTVLSGNPWPYAATFGKLGLRALKACNDEWVARNEKYRWTPLRGRPLVERRQLANYQTRMGIIEHTSNDAPGAVCEPAGPPRPFEYPERSDMRTVDELRNALVDVITKQMAPRAKSIVTLKVCEWGMLKGPSRYPLHGY